MSPSNTPPHLPDDGEGDKEQYFIEGEPYEIINDNSDAGNSTGYTVYLLWIFWCIYDN